MSLQFTLFLRSRIATVQHIHRVFSKTLTAHPLCKTVSMYSFLKMVAICKRQYAVGQRSSYEYNTDWRPRSGVRFPTVLRNFCSPELSDRHFSPHSVLFNGYLGNKQIELEACNSAAISAEFQTEWSCTYNPTYALITYTGKTRFSSLRR
jgi:hypothetical protein